MANFSVHDIKKIRIRRRFWKNPDHRGPYYTYNIEITEKAWRSGERDREHEVILFSENSEPVEFEMMDVEVCE